MARLYQPTEADRQLYREELRDFLPDRIFDLHSHLAPPGTMQQPSAERLARYWPLRLPVIQSAKEYLADYAALLPGKHIEMATFGMPVLESDVEAQNREILAAARHYRRIHPFLVVRPDITEAELEGALAPAQGGVRYVGLKPYPDFVRGDSPGEEDIAQFLTPAMCRAAERNEVPVMLHIAKKQRFADPRNIEALLRLHERYPRLRLIVAHLGRSYNPSYLEKGLDLLGGQCPWWYDFSAVTNPEVHRIALARIRHDRLCFGLDTPLMLARGYYDFPTPDTYAVHIEGYNLEEEGHFPLAYEILLGFKKAALEVRLTPETLDEIFYRNAAGLFGGED